LEARFESESFDHLIDFVRFWFKSYDLKFKKLINYLISEIYLLTYITTFEPETSAGHPKYQ